MNGQKSKNQIPTKPCDRSTTYKIKKNEIIRI